MRAVFSNEIQKVGTAGANVLLELGAKVEKMERLSPGDLLEEVHEAAEGLQMPRIGQVPECRRNLRTLIIY